MRKSRIAAGISALALTGASFALAPSAFADDDASVVSGTVPFACSMPDFGDSADFTYDAEISVKATRETEDSSPVTLIATMSDMPGVVPPFISMTDQDVTVTLSTEIDGETVDLTVSGKTDVNPTNDGQTRDPVVLPDNIRGEAATTATSFEIKATSFSFDVAGVAGSCTRSDGSLGTVTPELGEAPEVPEPTPDPTLEPEPTQEPEPTEEPGDSEGVPAEGEVVFACILSEPFNTPFDYEAEISVSGARATVDDDNVSLVADFSDIPGLAPVPIDNGSMDITVEATVADEAVTFTGSSTVNAASWAEVPVPRLAGSVTTDAVEAEVVMDTFRFEFGEMAGLAISADCDYKSGSLSTMTIGVGELPADEDPNDNDPNDNGPDNPAAPTDPSATLPRTGGGDAMPVIALWAMALGLVGAGALVWLPRRRAEQF